MAPSKDSITFSITIPTVVHKRIMEKANLLKLRRSAYIRHVLINHLEYMEGKKEEPQHK